MVAVGFVVALGAVEWLLRLSVPGAAAGFGLLTLALCALLRVADPRVAAILPVLLAVAVLRLATVALLPVGDAPLSRFAAVAVPALAAVVAAARACPREWRRLRPGAGGWWAQAVVVLAGVPLGLLVLLLAPHQFGARGGGPAGPVVVVALLALPEEVLFRGLLVPALAVAVGRRDVVTAAAVYAVTFISYGPEASLAAFVIAAVLGWSRRTTGSLLGVLGARVVLVLLVCLASQSVVV